MKTKLINNYDNPCKKISWSKLRIGDYSYLEYKGLCLKISEKKYFCGEHNLLAPIIDKENLGEVKVEVHWEKIFDELGTIHNIPLQSVKSQEPKTGYWRFQKREGNECVYRCSNCGRKITKYDGFYDFERLFAYCPECGAKMIEPQESE